MERNALRVVGRAVWILILFALHGVVCGQSLEVEAPRSVYEGQQFQVTFSVDAKPSAFEQPVWGPIQVQMGPSVGQSTSVQIINGSMSRSFSYSYTFVCRVPRAGAYTIPSASVVVDGKRVTSQPFNIEVVPLSGGPGSTQSGSDTGERANGDDLFVAISLSRKDVYQGEPIEATLRIYTRLDLVAFDDIRFPDFKGFWAKELETPQQISFTSVTVNGRRYNMGVLKRYLLYPQRHGEVTIDPMRISVQYRVRTQSRSFFDEFMGTFRTASATLSSQPQRVNVKPLPQGKPSSFLGGVGAFSVKSSLDRDSIKTNEAVTYSLEVSGTGNLQLLTAPSLTMPATVEVFPPKTDERISSKTGGQQGTVVYEYVLIPRAPGNITLPPFEFSYFDPTSRSYKTVKTGEYTLHVGVDSTQHGGSVMAGNVSKEDVKYLGEDIRHIYVGAPALHATVYSFTGGLLWWGLLLILLLCFVAAYLLLLRRQKLLSDIALSKGRRANGVARRRLRQARLHLDGEDPKFYEVLLRAIWGYLSDSLTIDLASLSAQKAFAMLVQQGVDVATVDLLSKVVETCEYARYAPEDSPVSREELFAQAQLAIEQIHATLKGRRKSRPVHAEDKQ